MCISTLSGGWIVRKRRTGERLALWVLIVTLGHVGMSLRASQGSSQDYINGRVESRLDNLEKQMVRINQYQDYILLAVAGGLIGQMIQIVSAGRARSRERRSS